MKEELTHAVQRKQELLGVTTKSHSWYTTYSVSGYYKQQMQVIRKVISHQ